MKQEIEWIDINDELPPLQQPVLLLIDLHIDDPSVRVAEVGFRLSQEAFEEKEDDIYPCGDLIYYQENILAWAVIPIPEKYK